MPIDGHVKILQLSTADTFCIRFVMICTYKNLCCGIRPWVNSHPPANLTGRSERCGSDAEGAAMMGIQECVCTHFQTWRCRKEHTHYSKAKLCDGTRLPSGAASWSMAAINHASAAAGDWCAEIQIFKQHFEN